MVNTEDCGSSIRGFEPRQPPLISRGLRSTGSGASSCERAVIIGDGDCEDVTTGRAVATGACEGVVVGGAVTTGDCVGVTRGCAVAVAPGVGIRLPSPEGAMMAWVHFAAVLKVKPGQVR